MNDDLDKLIERFRAAQDIAVATLVGRLQIPRPASGRDWAMYCQENGLYDVDRIDDVAIYCHGFGVELRFDELVIDFDWGDKGQGDGFDGWRLYNFALDNCLGIGVSDIELNEWIDRAVATGTLIADGNLYYDPRRREPLDH